MSDIEKRKMDLPSVMSEQSLPERYRQPSGFTDAGRLDRKHEGKHVVHMRDMQRDAIELVAGQARQEFVMNAYLECRGRALTDSKYRVLRNHKETQLLAADDPVLQAQMAVLDDEFFRDLRLKMIEWD